MSKQPQFWAIVPAAGVGKRMQADRPKQYLPLLNKTVLEQTLERLLQVSQFSAVVVAISEGDPYWPELAVAQHQRIIKAPGGKERADSVLSGLKTISDCAAADDWVLVHDAARPCLTVADVELLIAELANDPVGGILGLASHDTLKHVEGDQITATVDRSHIWRALTPQMFRYQLLEAALENHAGDLRITDEASALELSGFKPKIVAGRPDNIKITRPEDLALAEFYLEQQ